MKNLQIAWKSIIYADSTGADSSGVDNKVSKALFTHSFPLSGLKNSTDVFAASAAFFHLCQNMFFFNKKSFLEIWKSVTAWNLPTLLIYLHIFLSYHFINF